MALLQSSPSFIRNNTRNDVSNDVVSCRIKLGFDLPLKPEKKKDIIIEAA